eukprot:gnl/Dysnectes_brevis/122_a144_7511.p1 GENE.gnl/Dysnectes_brevis/122_a144_7511~~gnl/Dysnectes_brevis/122_a144_7511.p1  ORF type:complete len:361 (+),score=38.57 gnl/Dysnectes_brevis/122_a144_7511:132-1214(+)
MRTKIIDGSIGEGGGQIFRTSLALSIITKRPIRIIKIRANRSKPGLRLQHLACLRAAALCCNAHVEGASLHSSEVLFEPGEIQPIQSTTIDIGSPGSTALVVQTILLPLCFAPGPSEVTIIGGTDNAFSPSIYFLQTQFFPYMAKIGIHASITVNRRGFVPQGNGSITLHVQGGWNPAMQGSLVIPDRIEGPISVDLFLERKGIDKPSPHTLFKAVREGLRRRAKGRTIKVTDRILILDGDDRAAVMHATVHMPGDQTAVFVEHNPRKSKACRNFGVSILQFVESARSVVCEHLCDQLMLPLALCASSCDTDGVSFPSRYRASGISLHSTTNAGVLESFLPVSVRIDKGEGMVEISPRPE